MAIGVSMLLAVPAGAAALLVTWKPLFMALVAVSAFLLSVYNGPAAAIVDELGPPQFSATLQAVFMFGIQFIGNATAPPIIGLIARQSSVAFGLQAAVLAFGLSGVLFVVVARRQQREPAYE